MHISFGSDHCAAPLKAELIEYAASLGHACHDCGCRADEPNDYPLYAARAARLVQEGKCELGVVLCGTGVGVSIAANKIMGIRCALCGDCYTAKMTRAHNDANMLALGSRVVGPELAKMILGFFLETSYEGGRHQRRIDMLAEMERGRPIE